MLFSLDNLYRHYLQCRRNKRNTLNALRFEARQEESLLALRDALVDHSYAPARSVCFVINRPKLREIFAADFRDRIVHPHRHRGTLAGGPDGRAGKTALTPSSSGRKSLNPPADGEFFHEPLRLQDQSTRTSTFWELAQDLLD